MLFIRDKNRHGGKVIFFQTYIGKNKELTASRNFKDDRVINDTIAL